MKLEKKAAVFIEKIIKTLEGKYTPKYKHECKIKLLLDEELAPDKMEFPSNYYKKTDDLLENARLYEEALEKIREKYKPHLLDTRYLYNEELIHMEIKRESYCRRYNLLPEDLEQVTKDSKQRIADEARLAEIDFRIRDDNCAVYELEEAVKLEGKYGSKERVAELEKMLEKARAKSEEINRGRIIKITHRDDAKWKITLEIMSNIKYNLNPHGGKETEAKDQIDWVKKLDLLKERLKVKGIYLNQRYEAEQKHEAVIEQTWEEVNKEMKIARNKKLGFKEADLPPFDWDKFKEELSHRHADRNFSSVSVLGKISQEQYDKARKAFYERQVAEYEKNKDFRNLEEYTNVAKAGVVRSKTTDKSRDTTHEGIRR
ncbi:MAG: hypothetical protein PHC81_06140 [Clostridia bacterium]|nr:hypothetical protein [Clostridia bacterium]